jgi:hypothetical protein
LSSWVFIICENHNVWKQQTCFFSTCLGNENLILHGIIRNEAIPLGVEVHTYVCTNVGTYCTKLEPTWIVKHGVKHSQILMDTKNTMYKGKSLHIHRNNNNNHHFLEDQNSKHTHFFLIHLNNKYKYKYKKHTNPWPNP